MDMIHMHTHDKCVTIPPPTNTQTTDRVILEEVLQMVLEIINSCLTHNLHNNPHLIYSLLYQREIFEPYRSHPSLMDLVQNMETVSIIIMLHIHLRTYIIMSQRDYPTFSIHLDNLWLHPLCSHI